MLTKTAVREIHDNEFPKLFEERVLYNNQQAAIYLNVSESTLNHWRSNGIGPRFAQLGKSRGPIRYLRDELNSYINSRTYSSTAEAEYASAMSRVSVSTTDWLCAHPFIMRNRWFLVSSAYSDRETYISIFRDPFIKIAWLRSEDALARPWVNEEQRQTLLQAYLDCQNDRAAAANDINVLYQIALSKIPDSNYGSHPSLTLEKYQERLEDTLNNLRGM